MPLPHPSRHASLRCRRHRPAGFHLPELLVVVAVLSLLAALAWPAWQSLLLRQRASALQLNLHASLSSARMQALARRQLIGLCASDDGATCSSDWSQGWMVFASGDHRAPPASADAVLAYHRGDRHIAVHARASSGRPQVFFQPDGRSPGANLTLTICVGPRLHGRLVVNNGGRTRSERHHGDMTC
ncbi:GspH/FimT family protein [Stenotrophomonas sp. 24(2023)]|uniref:GspH/FimT family protein n=1 Tax=Stenotrophomonas sp. 24(2023) TaxID=3068324 RepID=UPI0027E0F0B2|nr:GspH/FimT family protein [Stenotrophomonas sp. 24(2023)]WMJ68609.1 GspH/FimT family protein [Stenotrophomonas sp. 24(2023)]